MRFLVLCGNHLVLVTILRKYELSFSEDYLSKVEKTNLEGEESAMYLTSLTLPMVSTLLNVFRICSAYWEGTDLIPSVAVILSRKSL